MKKGTIITKQFTRELPTGHILRYQYKTFESVLDRRDPIDRYLADCYEDGIPILPGFESASHQVTPVAKIRKTKDHELIQLAKSSGYRGHGKMQHECVQDFLLLHDSGTIAVEVPLYMTAEESPNGKPWMGHLDILRANSEKIQITDFKPESEKEKMAGPQVLRYILMFQKRTGIPFSMLEGIYFDDETAYIVTF